MGSSGQLQDACADGEEAEVRGLLDEGSLTVHDATEALQAAQEYPVILRALLEYGANPRPVRIELVSHFESLKVLAEFGFDIRNRGHLILQDHADDRIALDWILDQGVDINKTDSRRLDSGFRLARGLYDKSLHVVNKIAAAGNLELMEHLVSRGADVHKSLALHAVSRCHDSALSIPMLSYLLDQQHMDINADTDALRHLFMDSMDSGTPLCTAIYEKNLPIVLELLARGANVNDAGRHGYRPISKAIAESRELRVEGFLPAVKPLLDAGVDKSLALSQAVWALRVEAAVVCLQSGADPLPALKKAREQNVEICAESAAADRRYSPRIERAKSAEQRS